MSAVWWALLDLGAAPSPSPSAQVLPPQSPASDESDPWYQQAEWWALVVSVGALSLGAFNAVGKRRTDKENRKRLAALEGQERRASARQVSAWPSEEWIDLDEKGRSVAPYMRHRVHIKNSGTAQIYNVVVAVKDGATGETNVPTLSWPQVPADEEVSKHLDRTARFSGNPYLIVGFTDSERVSWMLDTSSGELEEQPNRLNKEAIREARKAASEKRDESCR